MHPCVSVGYFCKDLLSRSGSTRRASLRLFPEHKGQLLVKVHKAVNGQFEIARELRYTFHPFRGHILSSLPHKDILQYG